jgi:uncharacterized protein (TIGR03435 family)
MNKVYRIMLSRLTFAFVVIPGLAHAQAGVGPVAQSLSQTPATRESVVTKTQLVFDVASVKPNKSGDQPNSNFPLGPGDVYVPNGGLFSATGLPLATYIFFAYKIMGNQAQSLLPQLPGWVTTERFEIQARAEGNPSKDQMRLMMRSLLADRFKLAIHNETREVSVLALVLLKPGKTGPLLRPHPEDSSCSSSAPPQPSAGSGQSPSPPKADTGGLPSLCGGIFIMPPTLAGRIRLAARNVTLGFIADSVSASANLGRPMVDQTGLSGSFDFTLEWTPEARGSQPSGADNQPDTPGPPFAEALREQLGDQIRIAKGPRRCSCG